MTAPDTSAKINLLRAGKTMELEVSVGLLAPQKA